MGKLKDIDAAAMFAAGALSAVEGTGMDEEDARNFVGQVCKEAALKSRRVVLRGNDDDDDEESTWWDDWKGVLIPTGVGLGAFLLGANAQKERPDRGYFENAGNFIWDRVKRLMGVNESELWKAFTRADPNRSKREMAELMDMDRKGMPSAPFTHQIPRPTYDPAEGSGSLSVNAS